jgi:hypothetical protein
MLKFHRDRSPHWDYAVNDEHLDLKLKGRAATVLRPLKGLRLILNALKALLGMDYEVHIIERRKGDV